MVVILETECASLQNSAYMGKVLSMHVKHYLGIQIHTLILQNVADACKIVLRPQNITDVCKMSHL
jgi:hypothetical protein